MLEQRINEIATAAARREVERLLGVKSTGIKLEAVQFNLEKEVTNLIGQLGIMPNLLGYHYIRKAVMMAVEDSSVLQGMTKVLYPTIAHEFNTTPSRVERAIRHSIERAWDRRKGRLLADMFYGLVDETNKPHNSLFISMLAERLKGAVYR